MSTKQKGQFVALDPDTGEFLWSSKGRMGDNAAFVVAGDTSSFSTTAPS